MPAPIASQRARSVDISMYSRKNRAGHLRPGTNKYHPHPGGQSVSTLGLLLVLAMTGRVVPDPVRAALLRALTPGRKRRRIIALAPAGWEASQPRGGSFFGTATLSRVT